MRTLLIMTALIFSVKAMAETVIVTDRPLQADANGYRVITLKRSDVAIARRYALGLTAPQEIMGREDACYYIAAGGPVPDSMPALVDLDTMISVPLAQSVTGLTTKVTTARPKLDALNKLLNGTNIVRSLRDKYQVVDSTNSTTSAKWRAQAEFDQIIVRWLNSEREREALGIKPEKVVDP